MPRDYDPRQVVRMLWCLTCRICTVTVWNADQVCAKCGKEVVEEHKQWQQPHVVTKNS